MAKVSINDKLAMDTDQIRTAGAALAAKATQFGTDAKAVIERIVAAEPAIGTGAAADNFHLGYNLPATDVKDSTTAAADGLGQLAGSMGTNATDYERVDQEYRDKLNRAARA
ncbi:hypothetical protein [Kribbella sp. NPDC006257]|jgi:hypothetical protein|uniref:hypothetical protein n=1 Tax=Kribbella sp. NPDC006257 TaxID=3156738 RepID=UPI0033BA42C1